MTEIRRRPTEVTDSPEHRSIPIDSFALADADDNTLTLTGYASTFEPYEMYGGPSNGMGWIERIDPAAYERTLKESPDLHLLINHEGMPLARTKSGTLDLSVDDRGLRVVARLDRSDPDVQRLEPKMRRGDMDEMSFAFRVKSQEWDSTPEFKDDPQALRTITELSLHKGDVSVVNFGANPTTHAELKCVSDALHMLAECEAKDLVEARASDDVLKRAKAKLANVGVLGATGTALDGVLHPVAESESRADADDDAACLIAAIDAALDEACRLTADVDPKSLPEDVAQALDLMRGAEANIDKLMEVTGVYDPDGDMDESERVMSADTEKRESVSDHPWNFPQSAYTPEQWRHACLIDTGKGDPDSKGRYREPVREPDGTLNRNGVHAAAGRLDQVNDISDEQRTLAAKRLASMYRDQLHEDPPPHLLEMAHERSADFGLTELADSLAVTIRNLIDRIEKIESRDDDMDECAGGAVTPVAAGEPNDDEEEEEEENSDRGMSLDEARALETTLSLTELRFLE